MIAEWSKNVILVFYMTVTCTVTSYKNNDVTIETKYGPVRGSRVTKHYELGHAKVTSVIDMYLGIPYAEPPIGFRRFKPPEPPSAWSETRDATSHGSVCPQVTFHPGTREEYQDEDCLYLDIYVPHQRSTDTLYPVMVFIHGGSFEVGSGKLYDGTVLAQLGVIVVTINYRLGALGFMSAGTRDLSGNLGIMDQIMSLQWVQDNISRFRGDVSRVTVFGHSAGGASVGLLLVMPRADGLFHGVIAQSGSAVASYCIHDDQVDFRYYVQQVGELYGCIHVNVSVILDCLREVPAREFINRRLEFPMYDAIDPEFRPYLDGSWVTGYPTELFKSGQFHRVPVITGTVQNEFGNYFDGGARHRSAFDDALDRYVGGYVRHPDVMDVVRFEYHDWEQMSRDQYDRGAVLSDMHMVAPTVELAEVIALHQQDIYQYHFNIDNCYHSVELNYVFGAPFSGHMADEMSVNTEPDFTRNDKHFSLQIMTMWTNFAKFGNPTPQNSSGTPRWQPFSNQHKSYMLLHPDELSIRQKLRQDKVHFWNKVIPKLRSWHAPQSPYGPPSPSSPCDITHYRVNLWVFLVIVSIMFMLIVLLSTLYARTRMQNQQYEQTQEAIKI